MIRAGLVAVFAVALCVFASGRADAASIVQQICGVGATINLPAAPTNGNVVAFLQIGTNGALATVKDSNNVTLPIRSFSQGGSQGSGISDYTVSGSPTRAYTTTDTTDEVCIYELFGVVSPGVYQSNTSGAIVTLTQTIPGVIAGDIQLCAVNTFNTLTGQTMSNPSATSDVFFGGSGIAFAHAIATSTASSTCTGTSSAAGVIAVGYADYSAAPIANGFVGSAFF